MDCCCNFGKSWGEVRGICQNCPVPGSQEHNTLCQSIHSGANEIRDVCNLRENPCPNGKCVPDRTRPSGFYCECDSGFEKNRNGNCEDVNECQNGLCTNGICLNKQGSFECQCPKGKGSFPGCHPFVQSWAEFCILDMK